MAKEIYLVNNKGIPFKVDHDWEIVFQSQKLIQEGIKIWKNLGNSSLASSIPGIPSENSEAKRNFTSPEPDPDSPFEEHPCGPKKSKLLEMNQGICNITSKMKSGFVNIEKRKMNETERSAKVTQEFLDI
ncbi:hypothetical protein O181_025692 [Austropuccinia psidii MF-1]|uniref:Uncharacterized protein n=1 Tax=Austropuccinia psidii MF-1 TaxID=1389203 RepID=A0A9Q3CLP8_9BASI|nr:hypothetical protein [Austropuccinia psidii MF-1]